MAKKGFLIKDSKDVELSGWGAEYGAIEKVFFDAQTPTDHSSSGVVICNGKIKIPLHHHNCETFHYVLYGNGIAKDAKGNKYELKPGTAFFCVAGSEGAHSFENPNDFPLAILWVHAYPKGVRESTVWHEKK
jgi:mannose-6-phosphate isomerase-like protein (cupin superfamily)